MNRCSLCPAHATEPFTLGGINGHLCPSHAESLSKVLTKFVRGELQAQRRASRELEAELVPRILRRVG